MSEKNNGPNRADGTALPKFGGSEQGNKYDKVLKENLEASLPELVEEVLDLHLVESEEIPDDLQHTKERKPDLLKKVKDVDGSIFILQLEYQKSDDPNMAARMAEYYIMLYRQYKLPVKQFVIYIGEGKSSMATTILTEELQFKYYLISLSNIDYKIFLKSDKIEQRMLAVLGNLGSEKLQDVLELLLLDIESLEIGELTKGKYRTQLRVLLDLRNLEEVKIEDMALTGKIFNEEKDILYLRGAYKGEQIGGHKKAQEIARNMKNKDIALEVISEVTGFSVKELKAL